MTTFILVPTTQTPPQKGGLKDVVEKKFGNLAYSLPGGEWIVAFNGTSKQLSDDLGISEGVRQRACPEFQRLLGPSQ